MAPPSNAETEAHPPDDDCRLTPPRQLRPRLGNPGTHPTWRPRQSRTPRTEQPPLQQRRVPGSAHRRPLARPAHGTTNTGALPTIASATGRKTARGRDSWTPWPTTPTWSGRWLTTAMSRRISMAIAFRF